MTTILLSVVLLGICFAGMAIGLILKKKPLGGSCGGASAKPPGMECVGCTGDGSKCEEKDGAAASELANRQS